MTTFGQLRIVPSADIGQVGPNEGQALLYPWPRYYSAPAWVFWLVPIAAMVGLKANRNARALLILIPLAVVNLLYTLFMRLSGTSSSSASQFDLLFQSLAMGVTLLWLLAPALGRRGLFRIVAAFLLIMAVAGLAVFSYGTRSSEETAIFLAVLAFLSSVLILAPAAAAHMCRARYRPVGFMLWLGLWTVIGGLVAILGSMAFVFLVFSSGPGLSELLVVILMTMVVGAIFGVCLYMLYLPYMALGFASPFFRARFQACLNLNPPGDSGGDEALASAHSV